jgi:hypothetical protein
MKKNICSVGLIALAFVMVASLANATTACDTYGLPVDVNPGGNSTSIACSEGGLTFSNFQYQLASGSGIPEIDLVSASFSGGQVLLNFNPNMAFPSKVGDIHFTFDVTGFVTGTYQQNAGFESSIQETTCTGTEGLGGVCAGGSTLWNTNDNDGQYSSCYGDSPGGTGATTTCAYGSGITNISVFKDISVSVGSGHLTSFTEGFNTPGGVPEPVTMSLMGIGLLGIGLLGRRIRK